MVSYLNQLDAVWLHYQIKLVDVITWRDIIHSKTTYSISFLAQRQLTTDRDLANTSVI